MSGGRESRIPAWIVTAGCASVIGEAGALAGRVLGIGGPSMVAVAIAVDA
jgi:hypothetical protein